MTIKLLITFEQDEDGAIEVTCDQKTDSPTNREWKVSNKVAVLIQNSIDEILAGTPK